MGVLQQTRCQRSELGSTGMIVDILDRHDPRQFGLSAWREGSAAFLAIPILRLEQELNHDKSRVARIAARHRLVREAEARDYPAAVTARCAITLIRLAR